jgi:hypothetical protein
LALSGPPLIDLFLQDESRWKILEMAVGEVGTKWVSPRIAGFVVTFRFTPRVRFRL